MTTMMASSGCNECGYFHHTLKVRPAVLVCRHKKTAGFEPAGKVAALAREFRYVSSITLLFRYLGMGGGAAGAQKTPG
jgi:hypothetical protein